jgi:hypothetical protein
VTGSGVRGEDCSGELLAGEYAQVAREASRCPREGARSAHWLGEQAGARARQGLPGGDRGSSNSGELAARSEQ